MSLRLATTNDLEAMHAVRTAVFENRLSRPDRIGGDDYRRMLEQCGRGWVVEDDASGIVGFGVADASRRNIWALFVAPGFEARGIGRALLDVMTRWLFEQADLPVSLTTAPGTRAERFYRAAGWRDCGVDANGEIRFELEKPASIAHGHGRHA